MRNSGVAVPQRCRSGVAALKAVLDRVSTLLLHRYTVFHRFPYAREVRASSCFTSRRYRGMTKKRCSGAAVTQERRAPREKSRYTAATPLRHRFGKHARNPVQHAKTAILGAV